MSSEITLEQLREMASKAGLALTDSELQRLLPGVQRAKNQAAELREMIGITDEPAITFTPEK